MYSYVWFKLLMFGYSPLIVGLLVCVTTMCRLVKTNFSREKFLYLNNNYCAKLYTTLVHIWHTLYIKLNKSLYVNVQSGKFCFLLLMSILTIRLKLLHFTM